MLITSALPCVSYYKQNKLYRLVYDGSRQLEWARIHFGREHLEVSQRLAFMIKKCDVSHRGPQLTSMIEKLYLSQVRGGPN